MFNKLRQIKRFYKCNNSTFQYNALFNNDNRTLDDMWTCCGNINATAYTDILNNFVATVCDFRLRLHMQGAMCPHTFGHTYIYIYIHTVLFDFTTRLLNFPSPATFRPQYVESVSSSPTHTHSHLGHIWGCYIDLHSFPADLP